MGLGLVVFTFAVATSVSFMLPSAQLSSGATVVNHGSAIGGKMVKLLSSSTATSIPPSSTPPPPGDGCAANVTGPAPACTYNAGLLSTACPRADNGSGYLYKFTYGYIESRIKFPATRGFFTAFWMPHADPSYNYRSEIDILELLGDNPTTMFMTYHYNNRNQSYTHQ